MAKAKAKMRAGTYVLDMYVKGPNGTRRRIQRSGFATVKEMEAERKKIEAEAEHGVDVKVSAKLTVADLFDRFLTEKEELYAGKREANPTAGASTLRNYRQAFAPARELIGDVKLAELQSSKPLDDLRTALLASGRKVSTVRLYLQMVRWAISWGVNKRLLSRDVGAESALPRPSEKEEFELPEHAQVARAIELAGSIRAPVSLGGHQMPVDGLFYSVIFRTLAVTGLRINEALSLRWQDIDRDAGTLRVVTGKTAKARRRVSVTQDDIDAIDQLRDRALVGGGYVFVRETGVRPSVKSIQQRCTLVGEAMGFRLYPHLFRHYHASACIEAGMDYKALQERLGHESITTTMNTYGHLRPGFDRDAATRAGDFLRQAL